LNVITLQTKGPLSLVASAGLNPGLLVYLSRTPPPSRYARGGDGDGGGSAR
jgi:hypothetical protein